MTFFKLACFSPQASTHERLPASSQTVVAYLSAINAVHNDSGYPP
jgi:hypothetical protein